MTHEHGGRLLRTDIQGLRAIAVGMVVLFHLHPPALPGGYAGVDVFLVISGYLITAHLLGRPPTAPTDLAAFWGRRIRRLLPASLLVLAVTLVAVRIFVPEPQWEPNARDARSAALYVVNWALASRRSTTSRPTTSRPPSSTTGRCRSRSSSTSCGRC